MKWYYSLAILRYPQVPDFFHAIQLYIRAFQVWKTLCCRVRTFPNVLRTHSVLMLGALIQGRWYVQVHSLLTSTCIGMYSLYRFLGMCTYL